MSPLFTSGPVNPLVYTGTCEPYKSITTSWAVKKMSQRKKQRRSANDLTYLEDRVRKGMSQTHNEKKFQDALRIPLPETPRKDDMEESRGDLSTHQESQESGQGKPREESPPPAGAQSVAKLKQRLGTFTPAVSKKPRKIDSQEEGAPPAEKDTGGDIQQENEEDAGPQQSLQTENQSAPSEDMAQNPQAPHTEPNRRVTSSLAPSAMATAGEPYPKALTGSEKVLVATSEPIPQAYGRNQELQTDGQRNVQSKPRGMVKEGSGDRQKDR